MPNPLQDFTNALYGKYNVGTLSATDLQANITAICKFAATGALVWVNEDCVVLVSQQNGSIMEPGQIVRVAAVTPIDGITYARSNEKNWMCGVVYRGGNYTQPIVVAIQGEYYVKIATSSTILPTVGNLVTVSTTYGLGTVTASQVVGTSCIGVCTETLTAYPVNRLVKCMIQNLQTI